MKDQGLRDRRKNLANVSEKDEGQPLIMDKDDEQ
jgi:hypothetical protein